MFTPENAAAPELTLKELVELRMSLKTLPMHDLGSRNEICNAWKRLGVTRTFFEFSKVTDAILAKLSVIGDKCKSEEGAAETNQYLEKLNQLLALKKSELVFIPDGKELGVVKYWGNNGYTEKSLCIACPNLTCQGCQKESQIERENGDIKHQNYLNKICRLCKRSDLNRAHRCSNTESCDSNVCKLYHKEKISTAFDGLDVTTDNPDIHPYIL